MLLLPFHCTMQKKIHQIFLFFMIKDFFIRTKKSFIIMKAVLGI